MITFNQMINEVEITKSGKYIKLVLDTPLIEYLVGTLISVDFDSVQSVNGVTLSTFAKNVDIGTIVAVKFQDGTLHRLEEGVDL